VLRLKMRVDDVTGNTRVPTCLYLEDFIGALPHVEVADQESELQPGMFREVFRVVPDPPKVGLCELPPVLSSPGFSACIEAKLKSEEQTGALAHSLDTGCNIRCADKQEYYGGWDLF